MLASRETEQISMSDLVFSPAMIIVRPIEGISILYHYGLWVTENEVIHAQKAQGVICTSLAQFAGKATVQRSVYTDQVLDPKKAIDRARTAVGKPYHLTEHNCEAFVLWCATGKEQPGLQVPTARLCLDIFFPKAAAVVDQVERTVKRLSEQEKTNAERLKFIEAHRKEPEQKK